MAVKQVSLNVHGHRIDLAAYGEKFIGDNDYLAFGDGEDVTMKWDGTNLDIKPVTNDTGAINFGDGTTDIDVKWFGGASTKYVEFNVGDTRLVLEDVDLRLGDADAIYFGDADDVRLHWDGSVLSFMPITDNVGMITFGTGGRQMDVRFYGSTANAYCDWDNSASRWVFTSAHTHLKDGCHLYLGNDNDVNLYWTGAGGLRLTYYAHDTLNVEIGANSKNIDWKWWMGASSYVLFDVGNLAVSLAAMDLILDNNKKLYFGPSASGAYIWANTVNGRLDIVATGGIYINEDMRIITNKKLYLGSETTCYFDPVAANHMHAYCTQFTLTSTLVNATAIMLDAGTGGGGVAVRGMLRLWNTTTVGTTEGQIWYDSTTSKLHFFDGVSEREVTSS